MTPRSFSSAESDAQLGQHAAHLEGARPLEELRLQVDAAPGNLPQAGRREHRCSVEPRPDRLRGGDDVLDADHIDWYSGPDPALRGEEPASLGGDRAALDAVRRRHLDFHHVPRRARVPGDLVDLSWAHVHPRLGNLAPNLAPDRDMARRVVPCLVPAQVDARELVEGELAVWSGIRGPAVADEHGHARVRFELQVTRGQVAEGCHGSAREHGTANKPVLEGGAHVAHALQVLPDVALPKSLVVARESARCPGGLARPDRVMRRLGRQHAGAHRVVDPLQGRNVHEACSVADDHAAREAEAVRQ